MGNNGNYDKVQNFMKNYYVWFVLCIVLAFIGITAYKIMELPYFFFSDHNMHFGIIHGSGGAFLYPVGGGGFIL